MKRMIKTFRFQKIRKHLLSSLVDSTLYFAAPPTLNDPDDCQIDIDAALARAISKTSGKQQNKLMEIRDLGFLPLVQQDLPNMGVCCFSLKLDNSLMWSHYADSHRGLCLYYEIPEEFLSPNQIHAWARVTYHNNPLTRWLVNELDEDLDAGEACIEITKIILAAKSRAWSYEKEGRLFRHSSGLVEVPREFLKQVCFGLNTPDVDKRLITSIVSANYENVQFAKMTRHSNTDTGVRAVVEFDPVA